MDNIFNLLGKIQKEEDQITIAFGYILSNSNHLFKWFMNEMGFPGNFYTRHFNFDTQQYEQNVDDRNRTDLIISSKNYYIIVESKIRSNSFDEDQLARYYNMAYNRFLRDKQIKLVLITQIDEKSKFFRFTKQEGWDTDKVSYFRWFQIQDKIKEKAVGRIRYCANQFIEYLGDEMYDETVIKECKIKDIDEIAVFSVDGESMASVLNLRTEQKEYAYYQRLRAHDGTERYTRDAQYIGFYQVRPVFTITHIAKIIRTAKNITSENTTNPEYWDADLYNGYFFEKPIELTNPIKNIPDENRRRFRVGNPTYTSFSKLLSAENVKQALSN